MSFIVLLTLTMSTLLKTQLNESATNLESKTARDNAMLGLQIALADLQKYAGPDQRTTATADILLASTPTTDNYLTGVWNSADPDTDSTVTTDPITGLNKGDFMRWIVSQTLSNPLAEDLSIPRTPPLGTVDLVIDQDSNTTSVDVERVSVPGALGNGSYAYWVGDDGVKAKANLPIKDKNISYAITFDGYRDGAQVLSAAPRYGIEHFDTDYFQYKDSVNVTSATRQNFQGLMKKIISKDQVPLIDTATNKFDKVNDTYYHDFTTHSMGLLTNTKDGGLKEDLSLAFEHGTKAALNNPVLPAGHNGELTGDDRFIYTIQNYTHPLGNGTASGAGVIDRVRGPRWDLLQEHYNLHKTLKTYAISDTQPTLTTQFGNPGGLIDDTPANMYSFTPLDSIASPNPINDWRVFYRTMRYATDIAALNFFNGNSSFVIYPLEVPRAHSTRLNPIPIVTTHTFSLYSPPTGTNGAPANTLQIIGNPMVLLWNPYNIRLKFDENDADVKIPGIVFNERYEFQFKGAALSAQIGQTRNRDFQNDNGFGGSGGWGSTTLDIPKSLLDFEPGEIKLFSAGNDATDITDPDRKSKFQTAQLGYNPKGGWIWEELNPAGTGAFLTCTGDFRVIINTYSFRSARFTVDTSSGGLEHFYTERYTDGSGDHWKYNWDESIVHNMGLLAGQNIFPFASYFDRFMAPDDIEDNEAIFKRTPEVWMFGNPRMLVTREIHSTFINDNRALNILTKVEELDGSGILPFDLNGSNGYFGASYSASAGYNKLACWDIPRSPLLSIAQLQHAHTQSWGWEPSFHVGNSYASPYLNRDETISTIQRDPTTVGTSLDISYLMNDVLWDGYYFSSLSPRYEKNGFIPPSTDFYTPKLPLADNDLDNVIDEFSQSNAINDVLRNPRMTFYRSDNTTDTQIATLLKIHDPVVGEIAASKSAPAFMMVDGGFNVNSTSVNAWKALLGGLNDIKLPVLNTATDTVSYSVASKNVFSRLSLPIDSLGDSNETTDVDPANDDWEGFRSLSDNDITDLATNIVAEIKARGPAFTLADFINRKLTTTGDHWKMGPIQAAIDATNVVNTAAATGSGINGVMLKDYPETATKVGGNAHKQFLEPYARTGYTYGLGTLNPEGFTVGGAPGYLMQADILNSIGPFLNNRSNTFTIRTYGDSVDLNDKVTSKAYLEVMVQQVTDFVDSTDNANEYFVQDPSNPNKYLPDLVYPNKNRVGISAINQKFGRKFKIVSFKWLNESDL